MIDTEIWSISDAIFAVESEIDALENIKPRGMNHQCQLDDRILRLENLKKFLENLARGEQA